MTDDQKQQKRKLPDFLHSADEKKGNRTSSPRKKSRRTTRSVRSRKTKPKVSRFLPDAETKQTDIPTTQETSEGEAATAAVTTQSTELDSSLPRAILSRFDSNQSFDLEAMLAVADAVTEISKEEEDTKKNQIDINAAMDAFPDIKMEQSSPILAFKYSLLSSSPEDETKKRSSLVPRSVHKLNKRTKSTAYNPDSHIVTTQPSGLSSDSDSSESSDDFLDDLLGRKKKSNIIKQQQPTDNDLDTTAEHEDMTETPGTQCGSNTGSENQRVTNYDGDIDVYTDVAFSSYTKPQSSIEKGSNSDDSGHNTSEYEIKTYQTVTAVAKQRKEKKKQPTTSTKHVSAVDKKIEAENNSFQEHNVKEKQRVKRKEIKIRNTRISAAKMKEINPYLINTKDESERIRKEAQRVTISRMIDDTPLFSPPRREDMIKRTNLRDIDEEDIIIAPIDDTPVREKRVRSMSEVCAELDTSW